MRRASLRLLALAACTGAVAPDAEAILLSDAYLFSTFSSSPAPAGPGVTYTGTGATGFRLRLNGNGVVTGVEGTPDVTRPITTALRYRAHSGTIDAGEGPYVPSLADHVNSEVSALDDVGAISDGTPDALLNLDFGNDATVTFLAPAGLTHLLIGEDAGWDRFRLLYCPTETCAGATTLINWTVASAGAVTTILGAPSDFQTDDWAPEIDQTWLFVFDAPLPDGFLRIRT